MDASPQTETPSHPGLNGGSPRDLSWAKDNDEIRKPAQGATLAERLADQNDWIETASGAKFSLANPEFETPVIAHALGMCVRYNGHVREFYSVAEHCVLVSMLMKRYYGGDPFEGLMHDALEAYLTDVPSPIKRFLPDYKELDDHLDAKLRAHYGLPAKKSQECKYADRVALFLEAHYLIPSGGANYTDPNNDRAEAQRLINETGLKIACLPPRAATVLWMQVFEQLDPNKPRIILS